MTKLFSAAAFAVVAAGTTFGQTVDITAVVTNSDPIAAGDSLAVELQYTSSGFGTGSGPSAIGVDVDVTDGATGLAVDITNVAVVNLTTGALTGTVNGLSIDRLVAGQPANVFGVNPGVLTGAGPITFATFNVNTDSNFDCSTDPVVTVTPSEATNGGVRVYDDATDQTAAGGTNSLIDSANVNYNAGTVTCSSAVVGPNNCPGDVDNDNIVDGSDFIDVLFGFGATSGATRETGDLTGDGAVDSSDFLEILFSFGNTYDGTAACNVL